MFVCLFDIKQRWQDVKKTFRGTHQKKYKPSQTEELSAIYDLARRRLILQ